MELNQFTPADLVPQSLLESCYLGGMKATIHLLPWSRGIEVHSVDVTVPDGYSPESAAEHLFEASNMGEATAPRRSMSVGDVAEVFTQTGRVLLGCCSSGWVELPVRLLPELSSMSSELRSRLFDGMAARASAA